MEKLSETTIEYEALNRVNEVLSIILNDPECCIQHSIEDYKGVKNSLALSMSKRIVIYQIDREINLMKQLNFKSVIADMVKIKNKIKEL